jgi:hypothetical protein
LKILIDKIKQHLFSALIILLLTVVLINLLFSNQNHRKQKDELGIELNKLKNSAPSNNVKLKLIEQLLEKLSAKEYDSVSSLLSQLEGDEKEQWLNIATQLKFASSTNVDSLKFNLTRELFNNQTNLLKIKEKLAETHTEYQLLDSTNQVLHNRVDSLKNVLQKEKQKPVTNTSFIKFKNKKGNKVFYIGEVKSNKADGKGIAVFETLSTYDGDWKDGNRHGKGIHNWKDGDRYEGDFADDKRTGWGTYYFETGEKFTGQWKNDVRDGKGTLYDTKGNIKMQGVWKNDRYQRNGNSSINSNESDLGEEDINKNQ